MTEIVFSSSAWLDQQWIVDFLDAAHGEATARRFLEAIDDTMEFIAAFPDLGSPWESSNSRHAKLRYRLVSDFENYLVIYRHYPQHVLVARVFHASQDIETELG